MSGQRSDRRQGALAPPLPATFTRARAFADLVADVQSCLICPAMIGRTRVLSEANGPVDARILFVAEAPGRLGADRLGVPLAGDRTGRTFDRLLGAARLSRQDVFLSNAVLCNPRDDEGRNRPPSGDEVDNCSQHLIRLVAILDPRWVITLGAVALAAAGLVETHGCRLRTHVGQPVHWYGRTLVPLYHPGPRALIHRPLQRQLSDYRAVGRLTRQKREDSWAVAVVD